MPAKLKIEFRGHIFMLTILMSVSLNLSAQAQMLSISQVGQAAYGAGFSGGALVNAIAIADAESMFVLNATHLNTDGSTDYGLWQVNTYFHPGYNAALLINSASYNASAAYDISDAASEAGADWLPWVTFVNGSFINYLTLARTTAQDIDSRVIQGDNDAVSATMSLNVRPSAGSASSTRVVSVGTTGTVIDGPIVAIISEDPLGYYFIWWKVHWNDGGTDGWSVEDYMVRTGTTSSQSAPTATTGAASSITANSAFVGGNINANSLATRYYFEWGTSTAYGNTIPNPPFYSPPETTSFGTSAQLTGLIQNTTYHYQLVASNILGITFGGDQRFTTQSGTSAPTATTGAASSITANSAFVGGNINANDLGMSYYFEWGTSTAYGNTIPNPPFSIPAETTSFGTSAQLTGLSQNTAYHYQLVASNSLGMTFGGDQSFTTQSGTSAPTATTGAANSIADNSAFISGNVNPNGLATGYYFEWGTSTAYGNTIPNPPFSIPAETTSFGTSAQLTGLIQSTTYHYQLIASNSLGTTLGGDQNFTTTGLPIVGNSQSGNQAVLVWPTNTIGFSLEISTSLSSPVWVPVSPVPTVVGGNYVVTNTITDGAIFYRLKK